MIKYHPCSKEFQEEAKRLGLTGNQLIQKYIIEGKLANPTDIDRDTNNRIYRDIGYIDKAAYIREWRYENGIQIPMSENEDCSHFLGTHIAERKYGRVILPEMFGGIEQEMPCENPSYDFIVTSDIKIDVKSCCLRKLKGWTGWEPHVRFNNITDYFIILAFYNREDLNLLHVWLIGKNEIIRGYEYCNRDNIKITNTRRGLLEFKRFDWIDRLECLKNIK